MLKGYLMFLGLLLLLSFFFPPLAVLLGAALLALPIVILIDVLKLGWKGTKAVLSRLFRAIRRLARKRR